MMSISSAREHEESKLEWLRDDLNAGMDELKRGNYTEYNEKSLRECFDSLIATLPQKGQKIVKKCARGK